MVSLRNNQGSGTVGAWLFLLAILVLLFPLWYALVTATIKVSIANPIGALAAAVIYGGPVLGGFSSGGLFGTSTSVDALRAVPATRRSPQYVPSWRSCAEIGAPRLDGEWRSYVDVPLSLGRS